MNGSSDFYEIPDEKLAAALASKDELPAGMMLDIVPPKYSDYEKPVPADPTVRYNHRRSTNPNISRPQADIR